MSTAERARRNTRNMDFDSQNNQNPFTKCAEWVKDRVVDLETRLERFIEVDEESWENVRKYIGFIKEGYKAVQLSHHTSFSNGATTILLSKAVTSETECKGFYLNVASTLDDGKQGLGPSSTFHLWLWYMMKNRVFPFPVFREKDRDKYTEKEIKSVMWKTSAMVAGALRDGYGISLYQQADMEAGRWRNPKAKRKERRVKGAGVPQDILDGRPNQVVKLLAHLIKKGENLVFLPTGHKDFHKLANPNNKLPVGLAVLELFDPISKDTHTKVQAYFEEPFTTDDIIRDFSPGAGSSERQAIADYILANQREFYDYIMSRCVVRLPEDDKGIYAANYEQEI